ncbi:3'-5' exonuclease [Streptomyces malaysiensis]|uniref:3'-5' exonuclease n=1 Tax=Streptomyces malaysiensis TaxID=92644 RepID=UPI003710C99E
MRLAKAVVPGLGSYGLDSLLSHYGISKPAGRHRAMPDVEVTAQVLTRLLNDGCAGGRWSTLLEQDVAAGLQPTQPPRDPDAEQGALF